MSFYHNSRGTEMNRLVNQALPGCLVFNLTIYWSFTTMHNAYQRSYRPCSYTPAHLWFNHVKQVEKNSFISFYRSPKSTEMNRLMDEAFWVALDLTTLYTGRLLPSTTHSGERTVRYPILLLTLNNLLKFINYPTCQNYHFRKTDSVEPKQCWPAHLNTSYYKMAKLQSHKSYY